MGLCPTSRASPALLLLHAQRLRLVGAPILHSVCLPFGAFSLSFDHRAFIGSSELEGSGGAVGVAVCRRRRQPPAHCKH